MRWARASLLSCVLSAALSGPVLAAPMTWTFQKVADTTTAVPGQAGGTFSDFGTPALAGGQAVFRGSLGNDIRGLYAGPGGGPVGIVADQATPIPGGSGNFTDFGSASGEGGDVAFRAFGQNPGQDGIYRSTGGTVEAVADGATPIPDGTGSFLGSFGTPALSGGSVAFAAFGAQQRGVYVAGPGGVSRVADLTTSIPGGSGTFTDFITSPGLSGSQVALIGSGAGGQQGVYLADGSLAKIADTATTAPGGAAAFTEFLGVAVDDGSIVFRGSTGAGVGVYLASAGVLDRVADSTTTIPGGSGAFTGFGSSVAVSGVAVAFTGSGEGGQSGVYSTLGGVLGVVIDRATDLGDGLGAIDSVGVGSHGFAGNQLVLLVRYVDGGEAIYLATAVPEPGTLWLLGLGVAGLAARRARRKA